VREPHTNNCTPRTFSFLRYKPRRGGLVEIIFSHIFLRDMSKLINCMFIPRQTPAVLPSAGVVALALNSVPLQQHSTALIDAIFYYWCGLQSAVTRRCGD